MKEQFKKIPNIAQPLIDAAQKNLKNIEQMLYSAPAFVNLLKSLIPVDELQAILTDEQKAKIASGALELITKDDGTILAILRDPKTKEFISQVPLKSIKGFPELSQALAIYATQRQLAEIIEQIQIVQQAIEDVRKGQENDRLATAYSCKQKLLQAMVIKNPQLKTMALLRIISDAEDSRNLLMQSQNANITFIQNQPESFLGKLISGAEPEKINSIMNEIRENFCAVNMVSLAEVIAYQELNEYEAAQLSLQYYADYIKKTYIEKKGLVERLDLIDPSPENYWSKMLPNIEKNIKALPYNQLYLERGLINAKEM